MGPDSFTKAFLQDLGRGKLSEPESVFNPDMLLQRIQSLLFCVKKSLCPYVCVCVWCCGILWSQQFPVNPHYPKNSCLSICVTLVLWSGPASDSRLAVHSLCLIRLHLWNKHTVNKQAVLTRILWCRFSIQTKSGHIHYKYYVQVSGMSGRFNS